MERVYLRLEFPAPTLRSNIVLTAHESLACGENSSYIGDLAAHGCIHLAWLAQKHLFWALNAYSDCFCYISSELLFASPIIDEVNAQTNL